MPRLTGLAAWAAGALLLAIYLAPHGHRAALVGAGVLGALLALAGAAALRRFPWLLAFSTLLLVPLYVVVGAAAVELAWALARDDRRDSELGVLAYPLAAFVAWTGLSLSWTVDLKQGAIELLFFFLAFGLLALCLARLPWEPRRLPLLYGQLAAMGVLFAAVGIYQEAAHDVFWNPKVIVGNAYGSFFRVNSLFWDPSIYGRFLVVAILASVAVALRSTSMRTVLLAAGVVALSWVGLLFSYSQTSFASLLAGTVVAAAIAFRSPRVQPAASVATLLLVGLALASFPGRAPASPVVASATGGRGKLITEGIKIAFDHPAGGVGIGGFKRAYADRVGLPGQEPKRAASHTTPVTVAAEEGVSGFLLFVWLAVTALWVPVRRLPATVPLVLGLTLFAVGVHSLGYNALFEDPLAWGAVGLAAFVARVPREELL